MQAAKIVISVLALSSVTCFATPPPPIGIVSASGHFTLDHSEVWGNSTLFDGGTIETSTASSEAALRNGVRIELGSTSSARVNENRMTLTKGVGQVTGSESYEVSAGGLSIHSASGNGRVRVAWGTDGGLEITTLRGVARVANRTGLTLASIPAGRHMNFAAQAASGVVTRTGCLLSKDGRYLIQDQNSMEVVEVRGNDLAANVGNRVIATGAASALKPALSIATSVLNASTITLQQAGGCLSVAAALDAQTEPPNVANQPAAAPASAPPTATPKTGMSTGAKVGIVVAVAGGGAGAAIALAGKKKSTSP